MYSNQPLTRQRIHNSRNQLRWVASALIAAWAIFTPLISVAEDAQGDLRKVTRVVDGDTLVLDGNEKVRLIGVDTPETVHPRKAVEYFGREASAFTKRMAEGEEVRLVFDLGTGRRDKYGRTLGYIYLSDGRLLNLEIIRQGYGHAYTRFPFSRTHAQAVKAALR